MVAVDMNLEPELEKGVGSDRAGNCVSFDCATNWQQLARFPVRSCETELAMGWCPSYPVCDISGVDERQYISWAIGNTEPTAARQIAVELI